MRPRAKATAVEIDLTGSSKQVETAFNVPFEGSTKVACFCAFRSLLLDTVTLGREGAVEPGIVPSGER